MSKFNFHSCLKTPRKVGIESNFLNLIKNVFVETTLNTIINSKGLMFPLKTGNKAKTPSLSIPVQCDAKGSNWCNKTRKINKLHRDLTSHDKTVFIRIWHDFLGRKHQRIYKTQSPESLE